MNLALFFTYYDAARMALRASNEDISRLSEVLRDVAQLRSARVFTPAKADDPFLKSELAPQLAAQLYFDDIAALERACAPDGPLQALAAGALSSLAGAPVRQQAMLVRRFPVSEAHAPVKAPRVTTYVVGYEGPAEDLNTWLAHYIGHHPQLMARLPGIREIEVCTRLDWYSALPWRREDCMLRNHVAFDSPSALADALRSSARQEMRSDYGRFPPFSGKVFHYPMATWELL